MILLFWQFQRLYYSKLTYLWKTEAMEGQRMQGRKGARQSVVRITDRKIFTHLGCIVLFFFLIYKNFSIFKLIFLNS